MPLATAPDRRSSSLAWVFLLACSALYFLSGNEADNDLWGQVLFGRAIVAAGSVLRQDLYSYTAVGAPWVDHEWLSQVLLYAAYALAGGAGLLALKLGIGLGTVALLLGRVRARSTSPWVWGTVSLLAVSVLSRGFAIRPQIFTYLAFAGLLSLLDRSDRDERRQRVGSAAWLVPVMAVWVNLHGGFVLGVTVLTLYAASTWARTRPQRQGRTLLFLAGAVLVTGVNPYGWRLLLYIADEMTFGHPITEWQPVAIGDAEQVTFIALLALFAVTLPFGRWRERPWETVLAIGAAALALRQQRHTPVFALAAAAPLAAQLETARQWLGPRWRLALSSGAHNLLAAGLIMLGMAQLGMRGGRLVGDRFQIVFDPRDYPVGAVRALATSEAPRLNLAVPLEWGEYVLWHLAPRVQVSLDGRFATVFSPSVVRDNFAFFAGDADWSRLITAYPTDAALLPRAASCPIRRQPGWQRVYGDEVSELYVRADRAAALWVSGVATPIAAGVFP